ncbi:EF-hand calcium-binding domain-containing protein 14-like isoform X2 [Oratosquilla oratoria]|uniref:EF-hand calcium-binding domain-containing protein 14-like isoform X2 n=1 Tax=Oratosquilla oratoria TaxID=337810 RepID=UPI003F7574F4
MSVEGGGGGGAGGRGGGGHKKLRRKRKELDALVAEDKVRRKSSSSHHDLLQSDSEDVEADYGVVGVVGGLKRGALGWACLPGACTLLLLLTTLAGVGAALRLLMLTRHDLDALHLRINAVESSSSELPAKFHESHVRLQELEKNQTSMWETINQISTSLTQLTKQVAALEEGVQGIKASLSNAPQLSSLPKDVQALQDSVSTFGSSIQDVQSSLKVMAKQHQQLDQDLRKANTRIDTVKEESHKEVAARSSLQEQVQTIHGDIDSVNATVATHVQIVMPNLDKLKEKEKSLEGAMSNLTQQLTELEGTCKQLHPDMLVPQLNNASALITQLQHTTSQHANLIKNITQTVDMVKGVEKKLEGSQVQMASTVGDLTLRISNIDKRVSRLAEPTTTSPPSNASENHKRTQRLSEPPGDSGAEGP